MEVDRNRTDLIQELNHNAQEILGFNKIRELLESYSSCEMGVELIRHLRPSYTDYNVKIRQRQTQEAREYLELAGRFDASRIQDIRSVVQRAAYGGHLTGMDLRSICDTLRNVRIESSAILNKAKSDGWLAKSTKQIPDFLELENTLSLSISINGELTDGASLDLQTKRAARVSARSEVLALINTIIRSIQHEGILQENLITERNGRLVVPVKTEMQAHIPGLVHAVSDSGATLFIEPFTVIPEENRWKTASIATTIEEAKVLKTLSSLVGNLGSKIKKALDVIGDIDFAMAKGHYAIALQAIPVDLNIHPFPLIRLLNARHPLIENTVVPIALDLGYSEVESDHAKRRRSTILITGPNAGGKTVALKTVGLLALMFQSGLQLPVEKGSILSVFDGVYVDIGDSQSIEGSVSTFSSHIVTIDAILRVASNRSLVLLDELASSTDPEEGTALAKALIMHFLRREICLIATTHQQELAAFVQVARGAINASVELDPNTLEPTYRLNLGLPGRSYALSLAHRLGLNHGVLEEAHAFRSSSHIQIESWFRDIQKEYDLAVQVREQSEQSLAKLQVQQQEIETLRNDLKTQENTLSSETRRSILSWAKDLQVRLRKVEVALRMSPQENLNLVLSEGKSEVQSILRNLHSNNRRIRPKYKPTPADSISLGDTVFITGFPGAGRILSISHNQKTARVSLGSLQVEVPLETLSFPGDRPPNPGITKPRSTTKHKIISESSPQIDLRGLSKEDALNKVDSFLDRAILDDQLNVTLLHGSGTGVIRQAVRRHLDTHPLVCAWSPCEKYKWDIATTVELN